MIDFHSHILPDFDDGAANEEMSLQMLAASAAMGVTEIVSTSHCYPYSSEDAEKFLTGRGEAYSRLMKKAAESRAEIPRIRLGCELHLTCDLSIMKSLRKLCIEGTDYILLEMPMSPWNDKVLDDVYKLSISGVRPVIAHMERNFGQSKEHLNTLYSFDVLFQVNAGSFGITSLKKEIDKLFENKLIHVIGSDMHNMTTRKPNMADAEKYIKKRYGAGCWEYLTANARDILQNKNIPYRSMKSFKKKGLFG